MPKGVKEAALGLIHNRSRERCSLEYPWRKSVGLCCEGLEVVGDTYVDMRDEWMEDEYLRCRPRLEVMAIAVSFSRFATGNE